MRVDAVRQVHGAIVSAGSVVDAPFLLAVSGGLDSTVLLAAVARVMPHRVAAVACFDHATGEAASTAVRRVEAMARRGRLPFVTARGRSDLDLREGREAAWRAQRMAFLRTEANRLGARIVTAHSEDDQLETVLIRILRGSGANGLAGLYAESPIVRPLLRIRRDVIRNYAVSEDVPWTEDPSNASREFLRNRVRHDLLPALRRVNPRIDGQLLMVARDAAALRVDIDSFVDLEIRPTILPGFARVSAVKLPDVPVDSHIMLWIAIAARAGLVLDRRGAARVAQFVAAKPRDGRVPVAGGWTLYADDGDYIVEESHDYGPAGVMALPHDGSLRWGAFTFRVAEELETASPWHALVPVGGVVRAWKDGDRLLVSRGQPDRRVKRYLSDAGVKGRLRSGWPVVIAGDDVVWIPGVRRSDAATERSGRPVRHYVCERIDR